MEVSSAMIKKVIANGMEAIIQGRIIENKKLTITNKIRRMGSIMPDLNVNTLKGANKASQSIEVMNTS